MTKLTLIEAARRHASHYHGILERLGERGDGLAHALAREWPQIRRAREWSAASPDAPARAELDRGFSRLAAHALFLALSSARAQGEGAEEPVHPWATGPAGDVGDDPRLALSLLQWTLALARQDGDRREEGLACSAIGTVYLHLGEDGPAEEYFGRALEIARTLQHPEGIAAKREDPQPPERTEEREATFDVLQRTREAGEGAGEE